MKEFFKSKELWTFVGGAVTAVVTSKFAKSNKARELAVKGLASGMQVKDNVEATVTSIKEDAQDVYAEAVEKIHVARLVKICFNNQNFRENYKN